MKEIKDESKTLSAGVIPVESNNELQKDEHGNLLNPYFKNPDYIKSDEEETFESHGERVFDMIQNRNRFVHGIDKSCNGIRSTLKVLSECEGQPMTDAIGIALCDTGLTLRTISDRIRDFVPGKFYQKMKKSNSYHHINGREVIKMDDDFEEKTYDDEEDAILSLPIVKFRKTKLIEIEVQHE